MPYNVTSFRLHSCQEKRDSLIFKYTRPKHTGERARGSPWTFSAEVFFQVEMVFAITLITVIPMITIAGVLTVVVKGYVTGSK